MKTCGKRLLSCVLLLLDGTLYVDGTRVFRAVSV